MLDYEKQRQLIVIFIIAVVLVVIFSIIALIFIWMPKKEAEVIFEVGKVENEIVNETDMLYYYYKEISQMLINSNTDAISNLVSQDYLEYKKMTKEDIKTYLVEKEVLGKQLELVTSNTYRVIGYSNVYYLDIKAVDEIYSVGVVIKEISPENYTISFDKFIDYSKDIYKQTVNSVELEIYGRVRFINSVQYEFNLRNNYDKNITVNSKSLAHAILLVSSNSSAKVPIMTTLSTARVDIEPHFYKSFTAVYQIGDSYDYYTYNTLVLKDVLYDGMDGVTDIEYSLAQ